MERSPIKDVEIKVLLKNALIDWIDDREVYMKGIDVSYYYEGYNTFKAEELQDTNKSKGKGDDYETDQKCYYEQQRN